MKKLPARLTAAALAALLAFAVVASASADGSWDAKPAPGTHGQSGLHGRP